MDRAKLATIASLTATTIVSWLVSINQPAMMVAMTTYDPLLISLFAASWTAGIAFAIFGVLAIAGLALLLFPSNTSMSAHSKDGWFTGMAGDNAGQNKTIGTQMAMPPQAGSSDAGKKVKMGENIVSQLNMTMY